MVSKLSKSEQNLKSYGFFKTRAEFYLDTLHCIIIVLYVVFWMSFFEFHVFNVVFMMLFFITIHFFIRTPKFQLRLDMLIFVRIFSLECSYWLPWTKSKKNLFHKTIRNIFQTAFIINFKQNASLDQLFYLNTMIQEASFIKNARSLSA